MSVSALIPGWLMPRSPYFSSNVSDTVILSPCFSFKRLANPQVKSAMTRLFFLKACKVSVIGWLRKKRCWYIYVAASIYANKSSEVCFLFSAITHSLHCVCRPGVSSTNAVVGNELSFLEINFLFLLYPLLVRSSNKIIPAFTSALLPKKHLSNQAFKWIPLPRVKLIFFEGAFIHQGCSLMPHLAVRKPCFFQQRQTWNRPSAR